MPSREDLTPCTTIPTARSKWFGYFAHSYGIEAAGLPSTTCFVDIVGLDLKSKSQFRVDGHTGPRLQDVCTNPVQYTASSSHSTTSSTSTTGPVPAFMLRTEERTKFEHKIRLALATKPADAITKCWIPDTINAVLPYAISSKIGACAKRAYLLKKYPQYHLGVFGGHGVGKSTFLQWLAFYAHANELNPDILYGNFAAVCPGGGDSCTDMYTRELLSPTHYFYDSKGLVKVDRDGALYVSKTATGSNIPVGCEMKEPEKAPKNSNGNDDADNWEWAKGMATILVFSITCVLAASHEQKAVMEPKEIMALVCVATVGFPVVKWLFGLSWLGALFFGSGLCMLYGATSDVIRFKDSDREKAWTAAQVGLAIAVVLLGILMGSFACHTVWMVCAVGLGIWWRDYPHNVKTAAPLLVALLPAVAAGSIGVAGLVALMACVMAGGATVNVLTFVVVLTLGVVLCRATANLGEDDGAFGGRLGRRWRRLAQALVGFMGIVCAITSLVLFANIVTGGIAMGWLVLVAMALVCLVSVTALITGQHPDDDGDVLNDDNRFWYKAVAVTSGIAIVLVYLHMSTGGAVWTTLFGKTIVGWVWETAMRGSSATLLGFVLSVGVQMAVAAGLITKVCNLWGRDPTRATLVVAVAILAVNASFMAGEPDSVAATREYDVRCQAVNGTYPALASPEEVHRSSVHAIAFLGKFPKPGSNDVENLKSLKQGLTEGLRSSGVPVSYAVTMHSDCTEPTVKDCLKKYEELHSLKQGKNAILDSVPLSGLSRQSLPDEYDEVLDATAPAFLEPDRVLRLLELMHQQARNFYRAEANRKFNTM
eukprot:m.63204 g.63204  ORF g.63204 m.63204 type:complete len:823 (-) comp8139_c0_seq1:38-2506(-)